MIKKLTKLTDFMLLGAVSFMAMTVQVSTADAAVQYIGNGSIANQPNPQGYKCSEDYGFWIHNAGVVEPGIAGCDPVHGPIGAPTPLLPQVTGPAAAAPTATHRWWGSVAFYGEMEVNNPNRAGYITPDPITARITERGFRMLGIPAGLQFQQGNSYIYPIPDPFSEVFDGIAIANSLHSQLQAYLYNYSDGSVTVEWKNGSGAAVMRSTFVYGSPYAFVDVLQGQLVLKTKAADGPEKGIYHQQDNRLGIWTDVAGNRNTFLIVGEGATNYNQASSAQITATNSSGRFTVALLPVGSGLPAAGMINDFAGYALNRVDQVQINYTVDPVTQAVSISHNYRFQGQPVQTLTGLMPLQWKNLTAPVSSNYQIRSARGMVKFAPVSQFTYKLPFVGVLPAMPALSDSYNVATLTQLIRDFIAQGPSVWNDKTDTYWAGKNYGKVAELAALAHQHGLTAEHAQLHSWLKAELEDWFTAETNGVLAVTRYFSYDDQWNTVLGYDESFGAQQQLNDHHFHYGYFVRAAAEICRTEKSWCAPGAWGGMVELLIRDYAAQRNDPLFPYSRNFDPANGFSWASGHANFVLGNNNESTSEAANAYGAIVLYGLITGNQQLTNHGIYLHASSAASYWEYWNNLDRYRGLSADRDNFPPEYDKITTSIIWGNGMVFSTWFSGAYAHILGIQGLPLNPLVMHIGQHADYLTDYVSLGMNESSNGKPSGLPNDHWRDVWWNIWAMTDAQAAINDFNTMNFNYDVEAGETKAHTYHWIHAFNSLGHLRSGAGGITADYPSALVFEKNSVLTYVTYNYDNAARQVNFSDGTSINVNANSFAIYRNGEPVDPGTGEPGGPGQPQPPQCEQICAVATDSSTLRVTVNAGGIADIHYTVNNGTQLNLRMDHMNGQHRYDITNLNPGDVVRYFLTVIDGPAYDTPWYQLTFQP